MTHSSPTGDELTLGKRTCYPDTYNPHLLQGVPRLTGRATLSSATIPEFGEDIWNLYELSWLDENGVPHVATGRVTINAHSQCLIESKSFKLYLNSLNQMIFPNRDALHDTVVKDLTQCAQGTVSLELYSVDDLVNQTIGLYDGECIDQQKIKITNYTFNEKYLENSIVAEVVEETLVSHLLKSNCLITNQPDWGSVQIKYRGQKINRENLLRYLVSFRQHNEFHEQCVERIFCDILHYCKPDTLTVYARYTRRGGLDINPWRSNIAFTPTQVRLARQ